MRRLPAFLRLTLFCAATGLSAEYQLAVPEWSIEAAFAAEPKSDVIATPSPQGEVKAVRYFLEQDGERSMIIRFTYPLAMTPGEETGVYEKSIGEMMHSRPGQLRTREAFQLGAFGGERIVIAQPREKTLREVRLVVVGSSLYVLSAEWPASGTGADRARQFFDSVRLRPDSVDPRVVGERERWRTLSFGKFSLRFDATRWYRDPGDQEPGVFNFLRTDEQAEAQFIAEEKPVEGDDIATAVIKTAQEGAESLSVKHRGRKRRGTVEVTEVEFAARVDGANYVNHGYFYSGAEGTVQLRAWAKEAEYRSVAGDIMEFLDGLTVAAK
ncbi:MAG TPA: hypothetical protein VHD61_04220 [Lacunisphaera sp.]|nr:hypothetical protein [Lacunisphaera sp.]